MRGNFYQVVVNKLLCVYSVRIHSARHQNIKGKFGIQNRAIHHLAKICFAIIPRRHKRPSRLFHPCHRRRHDIFIQFPMEKPCHARMESDVRIVNLAGERIGTRGLVQTQDPDIRRTIATCCSVRPRGPNRRCPAESSSLL